MVAFAKLNIGDKFEFDGRIWMKITPQKKSCCKIIANAQVVNNPNQKRVFNPGAQVTKVE